MTNQKILITGGAGFIGSHVVVDAIAKGYEVVNLDLLTYAANLDYLKPVENDPKYKFVKGDIRDKKFLENLFETEKFDSVIHLAAESHVDFSITNPSIFIETNVLGTEYLLECAHKFEVKKFVHVSTDEVYGELELEAPGFTEDHALRPNSPYSASKTSSDLLVRAFVETFGLNACITRCSNNYGPHQDTSKLLPKVITNALADKKIPIYGKGDQIRDWLFVKNHSNAILTVLEKGQKGEIYNIGGNNEQRNIDIVKKILKILGKSEDLLEFVEDRLGHDFRYAIDSSKIKKDLGWEADQDFDTMLLETIRFYQSKSPKV
ncbi:MAG: dTDP-glucose 4,6-dehydratase [Candidatus Peregrinibacteria bacterium]|nr:dTDP-glucose 4,6-dehydratase [Candidatus Peregrinibacteria bacterium]